MKKSGAMFFKNLRYICLVGVIALGLMTIVGSNGGEDSESTQAYTPSPTDGPTGDGTATTVATATSFNISSAKALLAQEETVSATSVRKTSSDGRSLFTYKVVNQGLERPLTKEESLERAKSRSALTEEATTGSNLLAVDDEGNAWLAIDSDYLIKVMYTVTDPEGVYVYLALDTGWWSWDGNDYTQFIGQENCAFFRIKIADDSCECVKEGIFVQNMDDTYMQTISGSQKPIQFDDEGNIYFAGTEFTREESSWEDCQWNDYEQQNVCTTHTDYWINQATWNPRLYRVDNETNEITDLTPDNTSVNVFIVLPTGEIAYQAYNIETWTGGGLYMWQEESTIPLSGSDTWGVNFFTGDTKNAVMWGSWTEQGVRFARPREGGGVDWATLDTTLFGGNFGDTHSTTPLRIIVADDGRLYGVFESWQSEYDSDSLNWTYTSVLSVFQMLPYDGIPKVELTMDENLGWWGWMQDTPFKISKGYLYYTEQDWVSGFGYRDVIRMVKLEDRSINTLLDSETQRYEIYSWNLSGNTLYFSAFDLSTTTVVTGEIDTLLVRQGSLESAYLSVTETASALGATSAIQDIEVLTVEAPATDTGSNPVVQEFHYSQDNIYSVSIDFTKYMDKGSVETYLSFTDNTETEVESMKVWIHKALHLIPDQTADGLGDLTTTPLTANTTYTIALGSGTMDNFGWDLTGDKSVNWTTKPDNGWYPSETDTTLTALSDVGVAKYAGPATDWEKETFVLYADGSITEDVDASGNVRIEFSAKNYGWDGVDVVLWNNTKYAAYPTDTWRSFDAIVRMGGWTSIDYKKSLTDDWDSWWADGNTPDLFNGSWARYRVDFYGTNLVVSYSEDGTTFTEAMSVTDFRTRVDNTDDLTFLIRAVNPVVVDNLQVTTLTALGAVASTAGDILDLDFTSSIDTEFGTTDVGEDYGLDSWW